MATATIDAMTIFFFCISFSSIQCAPGAPGALPKRIIAIDQVVTAYFVSNIQSFILCNVCMRTTVI